MGTLATLFCIKRRLAPLQDGVAEDVLPRLLTVVEAALNCFAGHQGGVLELKLDGALGADGSRAAKQIRHQRFIIFYHDESHVVLAVQTAHVQRGDVVPFAPLLGGGQLDLVVDLGFFLGRAAVIGGVGASFGRDCRLGRGGVAGRVVQLH